jgi:hypothetical protein
MARHQGGARKQSKLNELAAKPYWREKDARIALAAWESSSEPLAVFAAETGLKATRLAWWRKRLGASRPADQRSRGACTEAVRFLPVVPVQSKVPREVAPAVADQQPIELILGSSYVVRLHAGFDEAALTRLLDVIEAR